MLISFTRVIITPNVNVIKLSRERLPIANELGTSMVGTSHKINLQYIFKEHYGKSQ